MPTKRKSGKPEMLSRTVEIKSSRLRVGISTVYRKGDEPEIESQPWLELKGVLTEAVKGVRDVLFHKAALQHWPSCERIVFERAGGMMTVRELLERMPVKNKSEMLRQGCLGSNQGE